LDRLLKKIIRKAIKEEKDVWKIQNFFSYIYEKIYHDVIFQKIPVEKKTIRLIEMLATPMHDKSPAFQQTRMDSIRRRSKYIKTKFRT
jgi:hypothetical protein